MERKDTETRRASIWRWLFSGLPAYTAWVVANLFVLVFLPVLFVVSLFDRKAGYPRLNLFGSIFARVFFVKLLSALRVHDFAHLPDSREVRVRQPCIFVANHRSWLDALFALALFPGARIPVKESYVNAPILGWIIRWIGCIPLDSSSRRSVKEALDVARDYLSRGTSLFVFPEGTRARGTDLLPFADVFFRLAIEADLPVVPVVIHSDRPCMGPRHQSMLTSRPATWRIRLLPPLERDRRDRASDLSRMASRSLSRQLGELDVKCEAWRTDTSEEVG